MVLNNEIRLVGNLVNDPKIYESDNGKHSRLRIAVNTKRGENSDTLFIDVKCFGWAYNDFDYFSPQKADKILVNGRLSIDEYTDKDGNDRRSPVVYANNIMKIAKGSPVTTDSF